MGYRNLAAAVRDLEATGQLRRIEAEVSPELEVGSIQRRVFQAGGPALLFTRVKGCDFPMLGNLFGTMERTRYLFRDTLATIERLVALKVSPGELRQHPAWVPGLLRGVSHLFPRKVGRGPVLERTTTLDRLPQLKSWPQDGGAFITLPLVYTESPARPGLARANLGMYRVQISGGAYAPQREAGMHYQLHRGIGVHHAEAIASGAPLRVNVFVGGPPSLTLAAVMPLPEGMSELAFAGLLGGHRLPMVVIPGRPAIAAEADFCLVGTIDPQRTLPEGPFGDHLGYYSLVHDFPVLQVEQIYHRRDAIWPFTTVGRPPQEDTIFGNFIHELTAPLIASVLPGVAAVHAVDVAGVHPLLLALGSERYLSYEAPRRPRELLSQANAILGQGQLSLAKFLFIAAREDAPELDLHDLPGFFRHLLQRVDWRRDLHFQTATTIDTLDYSGSGLNEGSKVVIAAAGPVLRTLPEAVPPGLTLPLGFGRPQLALPGILVVQGPQHSMPRGTQATEVEAFCAAFDAQAPINDFPLIVVVDDSAFTAATLRNFLWVTFTRADPAVDLYGIGVLQQNKHWGCRGALVIDARSKAHHAPPLEEDEATERRIDEMAVAGGMLEGIV
ncbi:MAG: 3-octaprenyl-4-hydroxybenzoate carboxy-lyase [Desulfuromonadales bacterium GWD2_61_12]|nr:MAG: 3-octaprenyl-4-hydroxybenzoate carboxy-lyase [Desulfuromonadales bacterium GWC2_61_20]OGR35870.1 MAG: 3-octaprenyl-4-hydroxybenzoate carboxy-lyase [Desulfuromonadales bacterium GWD2_61_12]HAD03950.1 3-octaprenyl-4-hydroxybenzoate carboxy-lyase [Desulfuromonas sp.]